MDADLSITVQCPTCHNHVATVATPIGPRCMACLGLVARSLPRRTWRRRERLTSGGYHKSRAMAITAQGRAYLAARDAE